MKFSPITIFSLSVASATYQASIVGAVAQDGHVRRHLQMGPSPAAPPPPTPAPTGSGPAPAPAPAPAPVTTLKCGAVSSPDDFIGGSGIDGGGWTLADIVVDGKTLQLGLRGKLRHPPENTFPTNSKGVYSFDSGCIDSGCPSDPKTPEWTINSEVECSSAPCSRPVEYFTYEFLQDVDSTYSTAFREFYGVGDVINGRQFGSSAFALCWDHSFGTSATMQGEGVEAVCSQTRSVAEAEYKANIGTYNVAQNSWKPIWTIPPADLPDFNRDQIGLYDFKLIAYKDSNKTEKVGEVSIRIAVKNDTSFPKFPPDMAENCEPPSDLNTGFDNVFNTVAECKEFAESSACPMPPT